MSESENTAEHSVLQDIRMDVMGILEEMPGGFFIYNAEGDEELLFANDACLRIFGCGTLDQFKELTGFTFPGMVHDDDIDEVEASILEQIKHDKHKMDYVEYRIVAADGSIRWIEDYGHYVSTEAGNFFYVFINDATDRLRARMHELEHMNEELNEAYERERENKELLRQALQQANAANMARTAFLNNMSHNIRTLLNAISGYSNMIIGHAEDTQKVREYSEHVLEASGQLLEVVSETLEVSRLESGSTQLVEEECVVADIVAGIEPAFASRAQEEGKEFTVEVLAGERMPILIDLHSVTQLMVQLLDNAFKYTEPGDAVKLIVEEVDDELSEHARIRIRVSDTGVGMDEEFMAHMYEPFEREGNTTDTGIIGTGLGLTIVRYIVDLLSGSIDVKSHEGEGTAIEISFTVKIAPDAERHFKAPSDTLHSHKVLVVEDNALNREIITCLLQDSGHEVATANDGQEAVDIIEASSPGDFDVVLMDIQMPVLNGYEATMRIREMSDPALANIPIIAVTSDAFPEDRKRAFSCGMNEHISKPVNIDVLNAAIEAVSAQ